MKEKTESMQTLMFIRSLGYTKAKHSSPTITKFNLTINLAANLLLTEYYWA